MFSDKIRQQDLAVRILSAHIKQKRLASTYLLTGEETSGKKELALAFASSLQCLQKFMFEDCSCLSCSKITQNNHPDVRWVGKEDARSIKIEEIRTLINWVSLKPYEGQWKVFIMDGADRLTTEAANSLLKTLEEPPEHTIFCLLVESRSQLLETIQSRSFEIRLKPLEKQGTEESSRISAIGDLLRQENWEDYLDRFQTVNREECKEALDLLMILCRQSLEKLSQNPSAGDLMPAWLQALDVIYECKEALDANANQKLVLSRLAMQLRRALPRTVINQ